jgi:GNAT superfamily N-acetyltransferase
MSDPLDTVVLIAKEGDYPAIAALVTEGLVERWGWHNAALNPDLKSFGDFYRKATVVVAKQAQEVVGCGVLVAERAKVARIVRMSVAKRFRRSGIGSQVLAALLQNASDLGYCQVVLETSVGWTSAIDFYVSNGFSPVKVEDGDQHFVLNLCSA